VLQVPVNAHQTCLLTAIVSYITGSRSINSGPMKSVFFRRVQIAPGKKISPQIIPWGEKEQEAFDCLKDSLCEVSALAILARRPGEPVILVVDARSVAIGACAMQLDSNGCERPVAYLSQKLTRTQTKWSTIEREAFAVIRALQKWHAIVFGVHIIVYSDHNPLT